MNVNGSSNNNGCISRRQTEMNENGNLFMLNSDTPYQNGYDGELEENGHVQMNSRDMALRKLA